MFELLWLIPGFPLAGFILLALFGRRFSCELIAVIGVAATGLAAAVAVLAAISYFGARPPDGGYTQTLGTWLAAGPLHAAFSLRLDALSLVVSLVVAFVAFLILLYSTQFMAGDEGYARFFAWMNLFVASMLVLVLADDLLLLYLGWEGVGLCSYLLIGFWYREHANVLAARKAFIVTRVGDAAFLAGLFLLFTNLGTLDMSEVLRRVATDWPVGSPLATAAAALLLAGAVGKSAQLPLQTWLPDAMAGPTPVSALIHAATMVTAGVYLIARTHVLFELAPFVQTLVAVIGAATLLLAAFAALAQRDIKRVLAYSTISQVGYMFLALGLGAWGAAIFHFVTHAFFKSLLFLAAGVIILALRREHDLFRMGGLRKELPGAFWAFLIGAASLSAVPFVTAGFYSKDLILERAWSGGHAVFWLAGLAGALLTSIYSFRAFFLAFFGEARQRPDVRPGLRMNVPLIVLSVFALCAGFVQVPGWLGMDAVDTVRDTAHWSLITVHSGLLGGGHVLVMLAGAGASVLGILAAWWLFGRSRRTAEALVHSPAGARLQRLWLAGWGFDQMYDALFVRPFVLIARVNRRDFVGSVYAAIGAVAEAAHYLIGMTQTGRVRWYAAGIVAGAIIFLAVVVLR